MFYCNHQFALYKYITIHEKITQGLSITLCVTIVAYYRYYHYTKCNIVNVRVKMFHFYTSILLTNVLFIEPITLQEYLIIILALLS